MPMAPRLWSRQRRALLVLACFPQLPLLLRLAHNSAQHIERAWPSSGRRSALQCITSYSLISWCTSNSEQANAFGEATNARPALDHEGSLAAQRQRSSAHSPEPCMPPAVTGRCLALIHCHRGALSGLLERKLAAGHTSGRCPAYSRPWSVSRRSISIADLQGRPKR